MAKYTGSAVVVSFDSGSISLVTDLQPITLERELIESTPLGATYETKEPGTFKSVEFEMTILYDDAVSKAAIKSMFDKLDDGSDVNLWITYATGVVDSFTAKVVKHAPVATTGNNRLLAFVVGFLATAKPNRAFPL